MQKRHLGILASNDATEGIPALRSALGTPPRRMVRAAVQWHVPALLATLTCLGHSGLPLKAQEPAMVRGVGATSRVVQPVSRDVKHLEEKSVDQQNLVKPEGADGVTGYKFYRLQLEPGERLDVQLKSERSTLVMSFLEPDKLIPMTRAIRAANAAAYPSRMSRIRISNPTDSAQSVVLSVGGPMNHAFKLALEYVKP